MTAPAQKRGLAWLWHELFEASLVIKGLLAGSEALAGLGLLLTSNNLILRFVAWLTSHELTQDPTDPMATWTQHTMAAFSIETQHFFAIYLLTHGALKLAMVLLLARRILWAYPAAMAMLTGFILYQMNHWTHTHSPALLVLTAFDAFMIYLVWREYRTLKTTRLAA
ncbi:DUF2127 domain-containing protein [Tabrizicola sp. J26]|uniref:DUF2127 domain-containing protein n=1 Tax=Alitabrizicola rongguiensis TaxID=2909234 RepID=UPI001F3A5DF1|nr:DUF2127 domain-containing protein [Tabrizicola rongguiensis]MCF1708667.1 DUF2127 domain-containing protein [Tabrizicola rongguiensis]